MGGSGSKDTGTTTKKAGQNAVNGNGNIIISAGNGGGHNFGGKDMKNQNDEKSNEVIAASNEKLSRAEKMDLRASELLIRQKIDRQATKDMMEFYDLTADGVKTKALANQEQALSRFNLDLAKLGNCFIADDGDGKKMKRIFFTSTHQVMNLAGLSEPEQLYKLIKLSVMDANPIAKAMIMGKIAQFIQKLQLTEKLESATCGDYCEFSFEMENEKHEDVEFCVRFATGWDYCKRSKILQHWCTKNELVHNEFVAVAYACAFFCEKKLKGKEMLHFGMIPQSQQQKEWNDMFVKNIDEAVMPSLRKSKVKTR